MRIARLMNSPAKGLKRMVTKVQWLYWKLHDNWVAYLKIWSRRRLHRFCGRAQTYWSQSDVFDSLKPCYVMLTFETKIHHLEWFAQVVLISVTPMLQKLEVRSQRRDIKTAFFSLSENWCLPAPSTLKPEEREFVVDSGASMHMINKKDWNSAELETVTTSRSPTTVITANGEVQTHEEAQFMSKNWIYSWQWKFSRTRQQFYRSESFATNTDTLASGSPFKNDISSKTVFEYSVIRKTSYQSWFLVYQRVLPQACLLQHPWHLQRRLIIQITLQQSCLAKVWIDKYGENRILLKHQTSCWIIQPKTQIKMRITSKYGETRIIPTYWNGCKNSERILWMTEFLNAEAHTRVLLMTYL